MLKQRRFDMRDPKGWQPGNSCRLALQQMAGSVVAIAPMIVIFLILQRQFIEGIAMTRLKG